jgi:hypothetical protein
MESEGLHLQIPSKQDRPFRDAAVICKIIALKGY